MSVDELPPPAAASYDRKPDEVIPAAGYEPEDMVWVYRHQSGWHRGVVLGAGQLAVMVRYQLTSQLGEVTDTVMPEYLARRNLSRVPENSAERSGVEG